MIRSRGANVSATTDDLRYWYEMGYFYGRLDALNGKPYDDRTPLERIETATPSPDSSVSSSGAVRLSRQDYRGQRA
ncbi:hypothetical protein V5G20_17870 [Brevibacillus borstelensis]|uniref:hypothetical protein n=1 Tax=Brevibacillus borstelensis TaxID=45462 RepID=UPI0030D59091